MTTDTREEITKTVESQHNIQVPFGLAICIVDHAQRANDVMGFGESYNLGCGHHTVYIRECGGTRQLFFDYEKWCVRDARTSEEVE